MTIEQQIKDYLAANILFSDDGFPFADDVSLMDNHIVDSTSVIAIFIFLEGTFGLKVAQKDMTPENFDSVANMAAYVRSKLAQAE